MIKWILGIIGLVIVIIIAVLIFGISNLGPMIEMAVNTYGPDITKTGVKLGDVDVSLFSASATLKDLVLGNPRDFKSPNAMKVGSVFVDVDEKSLVNETIIIDRVEVKAPQVNYEKVRDTDNFRTILNNIQGVIGSEKGPVTKGSEKKDPGNGKKIIIRDFIMRDGKVSLVMPLLGGKTITAPIPDIHLKDIGKDKGGASPAEVFREAFSSLYEKITSPEVTDIFNKTLDSLDIKVDRLEETAKKGIEAAKKKVEDISDTLKGLLGN